MNFDSGAPLSYTEPVHDDDDGDCRVSLNWSKNVRVYVNCGSVPRNLLAAI